MQKYIFVPSRRMCVVRRMRATMRMHARRMCIVLYYSTYMQTAHIVVMLGPPVLIFDSMYRTLAKHVLSLRRTAAIAFQGVSNRICCVGALLHFNARKYQGEARALASKHANYVRRESNDDVTFLNAFVWCIYQLDGRTIKIPKIR